MYNGRIWADTVADNLAVSFKHSYKGQLCLLPLIWNVSHLKIFPLELLGSAEKPMPGLSSSKGKILRARIENFP